MRDFDPVLRALEARSNPARVFFRDDDAGWASERLRLLIQCFAARDVAVDLAVIPAALDAVSSLELAEIARDYCGLVRFHQHGFAHVNHQRTGRKSEFGSDRNAQAQFHDIVAGRQMLIDAFGDAVDPIFTPPWNRCSQATTAALERSGITVLSRITGSEPLDSGTLVELPVAIDWHKRRDGHRLDRAQFCAYAAEQFRHHDRIGVMLHHAMMDVEEIHVFSSLMGALRESGRAEFGAMMELARSLSVNL